MGKHRSPGLGPPPRGIFSGCGCFVVLYVVIAATVITWLWLWRI